MADLSSNKLSLKSSFLWPREALLEIVGLLFTSSKNDA